jgi:SAM-dependent methyltransferase
MVPQASDDSVHHALQAYGAASRQVNAWIAGEQALGLLRAAQDSGLLDAARTPRTAGEIAGVTGVDGSRVADLLQALDAHGVVERDGERYRLAPDFALLAAPDAFQTLPDLLDRSALAARVLAASATDQAYTSMSTADALTFARAAAPNPLSPAFVAYMGAVAAQLPELRARWDAGARHVEFGCGAGGALIGFAAAHPRLTAVGIEIGPTIIPETRRRAAAAGVAARVAVRQGDARDGAEDATYDSAFWAQQFFAAGDRGTVLAALGRTLKPGGLLIVPTFVPSEPPPTAEELHGPMGRLYALSRVRFGHWGIPVLTAEALRAEVEAAGFSYRDRAPFSTAHLLLFRAPA